MISLPEKPRIVEEAPGRAVFEIEGLYPGYGQTVGNSMRRILLSSLKGSVITSVKIEGVGHEFSTIEGVLEDVIEIILNLKQVRFRIFEEGPVTITLSAKGPKKVTGKDFAVPAQAELINKNIHIATLTTKDSMISMEATVESGLGYKAAETRTKEKVEVGTIALDASFSPVRHINYEVENMRVGDRTDYNRVRLTIETDESITPREAFHQAAGILVEQFRALTEEFVSGKSHDTSRTSSLPDKAETPDERAGGGAADAELDDEDPNATSRMKLDEIKISSRVLNALHEAGIKTVGGLARKREDALREIEGLGDKAIQEIKKALGNLGITLKQ